jgi:hypothetical protein
VPLTIRELPPSRRRPTQSFTAQPQAPAFVLADAGRMATFHQSSGHIPCAVRNLDRFGGYGILRMPAS